MAVYHGKTMGFAIVPNKMQDCPYKPNISNDPYTDTPAGVMTLPLHLFLTPTTPLSINISYLPFMSNKNPSI